MPIISFKIYLLKKSSVDSSYPVWILSPLNTIWEQRSYATLSLMLLWLVCVLHLDFKLLRILVGESIAKVLRKLDGSEELLSFQGLYLSL